MTIMRQIRKRAKTEEIDYLFLMDCLSSYKRPRDKLTRLLKSGDIIRAKKSLYVFGKEYRLRPYSLEILANLIYGPSYVSLEYALSFYGLIPERVDRVTSICSKRNKLFYTDVGTFSYQYLHPSKYYVGITLLSVDENSHFLIATKEKALADLIAREKKMISESDVSLYLTESLRIDQSELLSLSSEAINEIAFVYQNHNVDLLCRIITDQRLRKPF